MKKKLKKFELKKKCLPNKGKRCTDLEKISTEKINRDRSWLAIIQYGAVNDLPVPNG